MNWSVIGTWWHKIKVHQSSDIHCNTEQGPQVATVLIWVYRIGDTLKSAAPIVHKPGGQCIPSMLSVLSKEGRRNVVETNVVFTLSLSLLHF